MVGLGCAFGIRHKLEFVLLLIFWDFFLLFDFYFLQFVYYHFVVTLKKGYQAFAQQHLATLLETAREYARRHFQMLLADRAKFAFDGNQGLVLRTQQV